MNKFSLLSISCAVLLVSACDHYSTKLAAIDSTSPNVADISPAAGGEMTFRQYLASEYYQLARYEQDQMYDYRAAKYYTEKAEKLSQGTMVSPASLSDFDITPEKSQELTLAREGLISALHTYNVPENRYSLAMAQTRYDCWVEQQEEDHQGGDILTCKNEFKQAISSLVLPDHKEVRMSLLFESASTNLSEEGRISLGRALSFWKSNQERGYQLSLSPAVNTSKEESERQLSMVRSILQYNGIPASEISIAQPPADKDVFELILKRNENSEAVQPAI